MSINYVVTCSCRCVGWPSTAQWRTWCSSTWQLCRLWLWAPV